MTEKNIPQPRLKARYQKEIIPKLRERFGYANIHQVPGIEKIVVSVGMGGAIKEPALAELVTKTLTNITGQKPLITKAKKSIAAFKVREGQHIGAKVTLRGKRMYEFLDRLLNITMPRVRDFQGIPLSVFDGQGNVSIGFREHIAFPEISMDEVDRTHGVQVTIATSAATDEEARELLSAFGLPFQKEPKKK